MAGLSADFKTLSDGMAAKLPGQLLFGVPGKDGGYYQITATQPDESTLRLTFTPSDASMPAAAPVDIALPQPTEEAIKAAVYEHLQENPPSGGVSFKVDNTLILQDGILSVNTTDQMEQDNTLPITSAGVYATVGNIEALLKTI